MNRTVDETVSLFTSTFGNATTTQETKGTMTKTNTATLPMDDPDLDNNTALFDSVRQIATNIQLLMVRVDGLTAAVGALGAKLDAAPHAAAASAPSHGGGDANGAWQTIFVSDATTVTKPKKNGGGTFTKEVVRLATGKDMDIARGIGIEPFLAKKGNSIEVLVVNNKNGYPEITGWR